MRSRLMTQSSVGLVLGGELGSTLGVSLGVSLGGELGAELGPTLGVSLGVSLGGELGSALGGMGRTVIGNVIVSWSSQPIPPVSSARTSEVAV
jgi:hypothetical protein